MDLNFTSIYNDVTNIRSYEDEDVANFILKLYYNDWEILDGDENNNENITNRLIEITSQFQVYILSEHQKISNMLMKFLEGYITGDTISKLHNMQNIGNNLKKKNYCNRIINICVKKINMQ